MRYVRGYSMLGDSFVWGADIGGLFTALGIGSIVIGFALQNAVGSVVSGLFLLFEQPFEIGDYLRTSEGPVLGKRVELTGQRADGSIFPLELAVTAISFGGKQIFTAHLRDITERKQAEFAR